MSAEEVAPIRRAHRQIIGCAGSVALALGALTACGTGAASGGASTPGTATSQPAQLISSTAAGQSLAFGSLYLQFNACYDNFPCSVMLDAQTGRATTMDLVGTPSPDARYLLDDQGDAVYKVGGSNDPEAQLGRTMGGSTPMKLRGRPLPQITDGTGQWDGTKPHALVVDSTGGTRWSVDISTGAVTQLLANGASNYSPYEVNLGTVNSPDVPLPQKFAPDPYKSDGGETVSYYVSGTGGREAWAFVAPDNARVLHVLHLLPGGQTWQEFPAIPWRVPTAQLSSVAFIAHN